MATINQIKDTNGTTHDIGCKWENIIDKPEYVETPTLHLYNKNAEFGEGGKIIFGDIYEGDIFGDIYDGDIEEHIRHYVCIEETENDCLNFQASEFIFTEGCINAENDIICGSNLYSNYVQTPILHLYDENVESGSSGGKIVFGDTKDYVGEHNGHFACIEELEGDTLTFKANRFVFEAQEPSLETYMFFGGIINTEYPIYGNLAGTANYANSVYSRTTTSTYYLCGFTDATTDTSGVLYKRSDVYTDASGNLNAKGFGVHASAKILSDTSYNMFIHINGESPLVVANDNSSNKFVAPGASYSNKYSLGTSDRLWAKVYASKFIGELDGNAKTATTAEAAQAAVCDINGDIISETYLKLSGGEMTGEITTPCVNTATIRLYNENNSYGKGSKIVFGDFGGDLNDHYNHYTCIEEIHDDSLSFKAENSLNFNSKEFNFNNATIAVREIIEDDETGDVLEILNYTHIAPTYVETSTLHLNRIDDSGGGKIVFGDMSGDLEDHENHFVCIEEIPDDFLSFKANSFIFNGGNIITEYPIIGDLEGNASSATTAEYADTANSATHDSLGNQIDTTYLTISTFDEFRDNFVAGTDSRVTTTTTTSAYYLCGSPTSLSNNGTLVKRSNVYVNASAHLFAPLFVGNLSGNATTASNAYTAEAAGTAESDSDGNIIKDTYLKRSGGTMTGTIVTPGDDTKGIYPATNNYGFVGSSTNKFYKMYATTFHGALSGNATTATIATNVRSDTTSSTYYLCGSTSSTTNTSGTLVKRSTVYVNASGNLYAGAFYETSDERLKDFSNKIDVDLDKISKIKKHRFTWKDSENKKEEIGVSAQEIRELYPEIVSENEEGYLSISYDKLAVVALAAIDKLHQENIELKERITTLENKFK